jgi:hypothetical protein
VSRPARVVDVEYLGAHRLRLGFSDGLVRDLDFEDLLDGGVFESLRDLKVFSDVRVDPVAGTICWPNGVDLDPDVLHGDAVPASGRAPKVLHEWHLHRTG